MFAIFYGLVMSYVDRGQARKLVKIFAILGILAGLSVFAMRLYDPKGMNIALIAFNRKLVVAIAALSLLGLFFALVNISKLKHLILSGIIFAALMYLLPPVLQYTREFIYFGEAGISTNSMLRALGFVLGLLVCLVLSLSAFEVHSSLNTHSQKNIFMLLSLLIFAIEYAVSSVAALQRLKLIPLTSTVFSIMIWRGENENIFIFAQVLLALIMLVFVIMTHLKPEGIFPNKALLRKEKARLRLSRRWSMSLFFVAVIAVLIVTVLHYYDTKPPVEIQPEPYELTQDGMIVIDLAKVSDGHLHKFAYLTAGKFDVRFLVVKKPVGTAYGVGLDCCEICGPAGYYERGDDEVVCKRCDVIMNKNTIGFKGGCNPIPFEYEIKHGNILIKASELEQHEKRFK